MSQDDVLWIVNGAQEIRKLIRVVLQSNDGAALHQRTTVVWLWDSKQVGEKTGMAGQDSLMNSKQDCFDANDDGAIVKPEFWVFCGEPNL